MLRAQLEIHPRDPQLLDWLGITLDAEHEYPKAEQYYLKALSLSPHSLPVLNNLGNHYVAGGEVRLAAKTFLQVVALQPDAANANLQLARISLAAGQGGRALVYLGHIPASVRGQPAVELLDAQALHQAGETREAESLLQELEKKAGNDPRIPYSAGMTFVRWRLYPQAMTAFTQALALSPTNFDILSNLGVALVHTGDLNRSAELFLAALRERPDDADTLYHLAGVYMRQGRAEDAIGLLVRAHDLAPKRPEILFLMGEAATSLGYYGDAAKAFAEYLKANPHDAAALREEDYALFKSGLNLQEAIVALQRYTRAYPKDPLGLYDLAVAESITQPERAINELNTALSVDPKLLNARYERALLNSHFGRTAEALADLKVILRQDPTNAPALGTLGRVYLKLGEVQQALAVLSRAVKLAPQNREIMANLSQALLRAHRVKEAASVQQEAERLKPERQKPATGLFSFAASSPERQLKKVIRLLRVRILENPNDVAAKVQLAKDLLGAGDTAEALRTYNGILASAPAAKTLTECGLTLLSYGQYPLARKFLAKAAQADPSAAEPRLNVVVALFHTDGPAAALAQLEQVPDGQRAGDYYLLKSQILDAAGKTQEARSNLDLALRLAPDQASFYIQTVLFLLKHGQYRAALSFCQEALKRFPDRPDLLLTQAITSSFVDDPEKADALLKKIESRWPEWDQPYLIHGIILVDHNKPAPAKTLLETAIALGAHEGVAYYNLAQADMDPISPDMVGAEKAIQQSLRLNPSDPYIQSLAARIAYKQKNYQKALRHAAAALRLWPDMLEAHQTLSAVYLALGEKGKYAEELKEVLRIKQKVRSPVQMPPSFPRSLLFSVSAPHGVEQAEGDAP